MIEFHLEVFFDRDAKTTRPAKLPVQAIGNGILCENMSLLKQLVLT